MSENERPIRDMKALLKFCMQATQSEDAPTSSTCEPMPEEVSSILIDLENNIT